MHDVSAFGRDVHEHDRVTLGEHRDLLSFQLPDIPRILLTFDDDHVKPACEAFMRRRDRVKLWDLPSRRRTERGRPGQTQVVIDKVDPALPRSVLLS